jgi:hypothetical protein
MLLGEDRADESEGSFFALERADDVERRSISYSVDSVGVGPILRPLCPAKAAYTFTSSSAGGMAEQFPTFRGERRATQGLDVGNGRMDGVELQHPWPSRDVDADVPGDEPEMWQRSVQGSAELRGALQMGHRMAREDHAGLRVCPVNPPLCVTTTTIDTAVGIDD